MWRMPKVLNVRLPSARTLISRPSLSNSHADGQPPWYYPDSGTDIGIGFFGARDINDPGRGYPDVLETRNPNANDFGQRYYR